ncbi:CRAL-TRIO domain-containing protein [Amylostereum chailletii]|nr:CRAL-TRIO domain-containing protein [Amylostereum chailletii]
MQSDLSSQQLHALEQLRHEIARDHLFQPDDTLPANDYTLTRFLRAHAFNVPQAKSMLANCLQWRRSAEGVGITNLYRTIDPFDFPERHYVFEHWPMYFHKCGRPVNIQSLGAANLPTLYKRVPHARLWQTLLVNTEALFAEVFPAASAAAGSHIEQSLVIIDLKGFSLHQFWQMKSLARSCLEITQTQFPETMGQLVLINAPASFTIIWAGIKPLLSAESARKVSILGADHADALRALVPVENLPVVVGRAE